MLSARVLSALTLCMLAAGVLLPVPAFAQPLLQPARIEVLTDQNYFPAIQKHIDAATASIRVMMFAASYYPRFPQTPTNQLIQGLINARSRGASVEVILERGPDPGDRTTSANLETARMLSRAGVDVYLDPEDVTTHTKVIIIDGMHVVIGSANWTYSAMTKNHEASVILHSAEAAAQMEAYFESLKKKGTHFKSFH